MGTSLHTLVQMVDNGLGVTFFTGQWRSMPEFSGTRVGKRRRFQSAHGFRRIALIWRHAPAREREFQYLLTLRRIMAEIGITPPSSTWLAPPRREAIGVHHTLVHAPLRIAHELILVALFRHRPPDFELCSRPRD